MEVPIDKKVPVGQLVQFFSTREQVLHATMQGLQTESVLKIKDTNPAGQAYRQVLLKRLKPEMQDEQLLADKAHALHKDEQLEHKLLVGSIN